MSGVVLPGIREVLPGKWKAATLALLIWNLVEFFRDDVTTGGRQHPRSPSMFLAPTHQVLAGSLQTGFRTESSTPTQSRPKDVQHAGQLSGGSGGPLATQSHSVASASTCVDVIRPSGRRMAAPYKSPRPMGMSRRKYGCPLCPWRFER